MKSLRTFFCCFAEIFFVIGIISFARVVYFFWTVFINVLEEHEIVALKYLVGVLWSF